MFIVGLTACVHEVGITDISYVTLTRYKNQTENAVIPTAILETSQEEINRSWRVLGKMISRYEEALDAGAIPGSKDAVTAIKQQNEMLIKLGIGVSAEQTEKWKKMMKRLIEDIVLPEISEHQRDRILERLLEDEEFKGWIIEASE